MSKGHKMDFTNPWSKVFNASEPVTHQIPCPTLEKVTKEELQAIAARVEALGIPCSVA